MAAGRLRDGQRLDEPAAGEVPPAVRAAAVYRTVSGAVRAGYRRPPVRARAGVGDCRARRPRHERRRADHPGPVLRVAGVSRPASCERRGIGDRLFATGHAHGAAVFHQPDGNRRVARPVFFRTGTGAAVARLRAVSEAAAGRPYQGVRENGFRHVRPVRARCGATVRRAGAGAHRVVVRVALAGLVPGGRHRAHFRRAADRA